MKVVTHQDIINLTITPAECVRWADTVIRHKNDYLLPPKISLKPKKRGVFFNTMPCVLTEEKCFGVKIVSRYPERTPSLDSQILLYNLETGAAKALFDGNWITAMRTGAVAATAVSRLAKSDFTSIGIIGLGNTARATLDCLLAIFPNKMMTILLREYKDQALLFQQRFSGRGNLTFELVNHTETLIERSHVVLSCLTATQEMLGQDECFQKGVLVIPVHTRGFENCDLFFDKVFGDDTGHIRDFKYFNRFRQYAELTDVLLGHSVGRENDDERILSYNIGIGVQDVYFASQILKKITGGMKISLMSPNKKFWI